MKSKMFLKTPFIKINLTSPDIRICEIDIGTPKYTTFTKFVHVRNFYSPSWCNG